MKRRFAFDLADLIMLGAAAVVMRFGWGCFVALGLVVAAILKAMFFNRIGTVGTAYYQGATGASAEWSRFRDRMKTTFGGQKRQEAQEDRGSTSANHLVIVCPQCSTQLRIPTGKGHVRITCPKCGNKFDSYT